MSFENLPKGSILYIEAKDLLNMSTSGTPTFTYPGASTTTTAGGQPYISSVATRNNLASTNKDELSFRRITEHNRDSFTIRPLRIEQNTRMANGTLRRFFVAEKKQFDLNWTMLPSYRNETVDGAWGAEDIKAFYESANGRKSFRIKINTSSSASAADSSTDNIYTVVFTSCEFTVVKRGLQPYWNVSVSLEQV